MVVKRFISIALAGLLAIGSINTGSVRAYAADEDLLLEEASFEESTEELLEEEEFVEEATDAAASEEAAEEEVVEEPVVGEELGEEEGAFAASSASTVEAKYTVTINFFAEDGKTKLKNSIEKYQKITNLSL